ncbi:MAG: hypothetical protein J07HN4v3_00801 [Halonotius sp. J07HN4]|nr:MAG: hypothetical protein J07HN4v3_00801 [Halonotius sp. J07HN4]
MSLAAETREAVRERPALYDALRAGVVNYTAAAETLAIDGDREAIATALRRFAESLDAPDASDRSLTVRMDRRIDAESADSLPVLDGDVVADAVDTATESLTAIRASGDVDSALLSTVLDRLRIADIDVLAAGVAGDALVVLVPKRSGASALQCVEGVRQGVDSTASSGRRDSHRVCHSP